MVTLERWPEVERWLLAALDYPEAERDAFISELVPEDLRDLVRRLIRDLDDPDLSGALPLDPSWVSEAGLHLDPSDAGSTARPETGPCQIGPYRLHTLLGRGGMGDVYLATRESPGFPAAAALKVLRQDLTGDDPPLRFRRERMMLAALDTPYAPRLLDAGTTADGRPYYVMEYVEGEPITTYCRREALPLKRRLRLFEEVCAAVGHVHRHLIVHRDLKPSNVFVAALGDGPRVQLLDFGIATLLLPGDPARPTTRSDAPASDRSVLSLTQEGAAPFTSAYAAPEQRAGDPVTPATDLYALGVLLRELVTGRPGRREPEPVKEVREDVAAALQDVCEHAMCADPSARPASAEAIAEAVRRCRESLAPPRTRRQNE